VLPRLLDEILVWTAITGVLVYAFLASISSIFSIRRRTLELDASAARTELSALRARLEPHFLYNTLESISGLVRSNPDAAEDAIARLGHALRRLLDGRSEEGGPTPDRLVSVAEELAFVRDTLFIEKLRMGDRLKLVESIDPNTLELAIPALTLQPLVQNAIQHGLSGKREGGTLSIVSRLDGGDLVLEVADDGAGTDEQTIAKAKGLGLDHLRRRLLGHFGNRASINVAASPEFGVSVQISVPAVEA
jgi:two-component system, LytTR family, sensor kinase